MRICAATLAPMSQPSANNALWLDSNDAFQRHCRQLPPETPVAIDTEFDSTRTYHPVLALVQMAVSPSQCAIVDPLAITDWRELSHLLSDASRPKLVFSGCNDLPILVRACGGPQSCLPRAILDLQTACGFYGKDARLSLKAVIESELGIVLEKSETRSDWLQRPLTARQLEYAAGDVALLPQIAKIQEERLRANGNWDFYLDEMRQFSDPQAYLEPPLEHACHRFQGFMAKCPPSGQSLIRHLAIWREATARRDDITRNRILRDEQLIWLAQNRPRNINALRSMPMARGAVIRAYGEEMLEALAHAPEAEDAPPPHAEPRNTPALKAKIQILSNRIAKLVQKRAAERQIDPVLLATRGQIDALVWRRLQKLPTDGMLIITGWRAKILQPTLDEILP